MVSSGNTVTHNTYRLMRGQGLSALRDRGWMSFLMTSRTKFHTDGTETHRYWHTHWDRMGILGWGEVG